MLKCKPAPPSRALWPTSGVLGAPHATRVILQGSGLNAIAKFTLESYVVQAGPQGWSLSCVQPSLDDEREAQMSLQLGIASSDARGLQASPQARVGRRGSSGSQPTGESSRRIVLSDGWVVSCLLASTFFQRLRGLLGRDEGFLGGGVLCLMPCNDIHTFGIRYPIDVAFLDAQGAVLLVRRGMPAGRRLKCPGAAMVLERVGNDSRWLAPGEQVRFL